MQRERFLNRSFTGEAFSWSIPVLPHLGGAFLSLSPEPDADVLPCYGISAVAAASASHPTPRLLPHVPALDRVARPWPCLSMPPVRARPAAQRL